MLNASNVLRMTTNTDPTPFHQARTLTFRHVTADWVAGFDHNGHASPVMIVRADNDLWAVRDGRDRAVAYARTLSDAQALAAAEDSRHRY